MTIPWGAFFSPTDPPDGYYQQLAEAGCTHVEFGTETMSDSMLASYGKPFRTKHIKTAHDQAVAAGLHVAHYLALGGPGESASTIDETLAFAEGCRKTVFFFFAGLRILPRTPLHDLAVAEGKIKPNQNLLEPAFYQPDSVSLAELLARVSKRAQGRGNWIVGAGGEKMARVVSRFYDRGRTGPLWEKLIDAT